MNLTLVNNGGETLFNDKYGYDVLDLYIKNCEE